MDSTGFGAVCPQAAQRVFLDVIAQLLHLVEILKRGVAAGDLVKHLIKALGADPARRALAAALVDGEFEEKLGDIDHAVVLVHDNQAA